VNNSITQRYERDVNVTD